MPDQVAVFLLFLSKGRKEFLGSARGNCPEVIGQIIMVHSQTVITYSQGALLALGKGKVNPWVKGKSFELLVCK